MTAPTVDDDGVVELRLNADEARDLAVELLEAADAAENLPDDEYSAGVRHGIDAVISVLSSTAAVNRRTRLTDISWDDVRGIAASWTEAF